MRPIKILGTSWQSRFIIKDFYICFEWNDVKRERASCRTQLYIAIGSAGAYRPSGNLIDAFMKHCCKKRS
jgi:hypothetical protein